MTNHHRSEIITNHPQKSSHNARFHPSPLLDGRIVGTALLSREAEADPVDNRPHAWVGTHLDGERCRHHHSLLLMPPLPPPLRRIQRRGELCCHPPVPATIGEEVEEIGERRWRRSERGGKGEREKENGCDEGEKEIRTKVLIACAALSLHMRLGTFFNF